MSKKSRWEKTRQELRMAIIRGELEYRWGKTTVPGTQTCEVTPDWAVSPIGTIWFRWVGNKTIEILYCHVHERLRRIGVMTYMFRALAKGWGPEQLTTVMTAQGNRYSKPWLKKMGFSQNQDGDWINVRTVAAPKAKGRKAKKR